MNKSNTRINRALPFFEAIESTESSGVKKNCFQCKLCKEIKNGTQKSNLIIHLQRKHKDIFESEIVLKSDPPAERDRMKLLQHLTEIVTINKTPFNLLLKSGFQKIISEQLRKLEEVGMGINLHDPNLTQIKEHLHDTADRIKKKLKTEVDNKFFAMSCDVVSKNSRSILGIYIQYILQGVLKVRCIGMIELKQRHDGEYLCHIVNARLHEFGWTMHRVVSLTTDNAGNMRTMRQHMSDKLSGPTSERVDDNR